MDAPPSPGKEKQREPKEKVLRNNSDRHHRQRSPKDKKASTADEEREAIAPEPPKAAPPRWQLVDLSIRKDDSGMSLLPGEEASKVFPNVSLLRGSPDAGPKTLALGALCITNFRVYFREKDAASVSGYGAVAFAAVSSVTKSNKHGFGVKLLVKDGRKLIVIVGDRGIRRDAHQLIFASVFPHKAAFFAYKFKYVARGGAADDGWRLFDEAAEYTRIGLPGDQYRVTEINKRYAACRSYPELLFVPKAVTDKELQAVAKFRSSHRMPVVTWLHPRTGASLTRCSQPLVGLLNHKSKEDAAFVAALISAAPRSDGKLVMLDPRPSANASANKLRGGGVEDLGAYRGCTLEFGDIENIHVVRTNLSKVFKLCRRSARKNGASLPDTFTVQFLETGWPQQIQSIMRQAQRIVDLMCEGVPVLVHCSDGWDRTCQTISLAVLCMDHYYRTLRGLAVLIEKEWVSYGHKFAQRHGADKNIGKEKDEQRAPIFFQFLDCLYQLLQQHPTAFEFNADLLIAIADHAHSAVFGTFLANNVAERQEMKLSSETASLWTYALHASDTQRAFLNPNFAPTTDTLKMTCTLSQMKFFGAYYMRWAGPSPPPLNYLLRTAP